MAVVLSIIIVVFFVKLWISILNYRHSTQGVPENVNHIYDQEAYQKWLDYHKDQMLFGLVSSVFDFVLIIGLLVFKVFGYMESLGLMVSSNIYIQLMVFLGVYYVGTSIISIPFKYFETFVIEEKHGFNKTTKKTFWVDFIKEFFVSMFLLGGILLGLNALYIVFKDMIWVFVLSAWAVLSIVMILMFVLNTKVFVKIFNKLIPLEEGSLKSKIDELASSLGYEIENISIMDASKRTTKLNAFFSGLGKHRDVVLFDTLIEKMGEEEILAVLGHELSHALNKDTLKMLVSQILVFGVFATSIAVILNWASLFTDFGLIGINFGFAMILFTILVEPIDMVLGIPKNYVSRVAEYKADHFGAEHVSKEAMIHALEILAKENFSNLNPHPLYVMLYDNHPTISERIEAIQKA